jgi:hypothetical protein
MLPLDERGSLVAVADAGTAGPVIADVVNRLGPPTGADVAAVDARWRANNYLTGPLGAWAEQG